MGFIDSLDPNPIVPAGGAGSLNSTEHGHDPVALRPVVLRLQREGMSTQDIATYLRLLHSQVLVLLEDPAQ